MTRRRRRLEKSLAPGHTVVHGGKHLKIKDAAGRTVATVGATPGRGGRRRANERALLRRVGVLETKGADVAPKQKWTRDGAVRALKQWAEAHGGRAPRQHELRNAKPPLPSASFLHRELGGLRNAVIAAGLPAAPKGSGTRKPGKGHKVEVTPPATSALVIPPAKPVAPGGNGSTNEGQLDRLVAELKEAEAVLATVRDPYIEARDRVQMARLELIALLEDEKGL